MDKDILSKVDWNEYCKKLCYFEDRDDFSGALKYIDSMIEKFQPTDEEEKKYQADMIKGRNKATKENIKAIFEGTYVSVGEDFIGHLHQTKKHLPEKRYVDHFRADRKEILEKMETQRSNEEAKKTKSKIQFWRKKKP